MCSEYTYQEPPIGRTPYLSVLIGYGGIRRDRFYKIHRTYLGRSTHMTATNDMMPDIIIHLTHALPPLMTAEKPPMLFL